MNKVHFKFAEAPRQLRVVSGNVPTQRRFRTVQSTPTRAPQPVVGVHRRAETRRDRADIRQTEDEIRQLSRRIGFVREDGTARGRPFDAAVFYHALPSWNKLTVLELGARDGLFAAYLSAKQNVRAAAADYYEEWGKGTPDDLGQPTEWAAIWRTAIDAVSDMEAGTFSADVQDGLAMSYPDNLFDVVVFSGLLEHVWGQGAEKSGDLALLAEVSRVAKPGALVVMSTLLTDAEHSQDFSGTSFYSKLDLEDRLLCNPLFEVVGEPRGQLELAQGDCVFELPNGRRASPVFLVLRVRG